MTRTEYTRLGTIETSLSVAVWLRDAYTGKTPHVNPRVHLLERPEQFTRNPSGYHVLTDLPPDLSSVTIGIDGADRYLPERRVLDADDLGDLPQILEIDLLPAPAYRFPADATLLRGVVGTTENSRIVDPVPDVDVTIDSASGEASESDPGFTARGRSDASGEYVLFVRGLTADNVAPEYDDDDDPDPDRSRVVHVDGERPVVRAVDQKTGRETTTAVGVVEGATTSLNIEF